jgi:hypothetical protein
MAVARVVTFGGVSQSRMKELKRESKATHSKDGRTSAEAASLEGWEDEGGA